MGTYSVEQLRNSMRAIEAAFLVGVQGVTEVWLVRHGDCYDQIEEVDDPPLSVRGQEQARLLGERIKRVGADAVYSSPLRRARQTADAISSDVKIDERLREIGMASEPPGAGSAPEALLNRYVSFNEPPEEVTARMRGIVEDARRSHSGKRIVMVSHGGAILAHLCDVLRLDFGALRLLPFYTSVSVVRMLGDRRMVGALGDVSHLEHLPA